MNDLSSFYMTEINRFNFNGDFQHVRESREKLVSNISAKKLLLDPTDLKHELFLLTICHDIYDWFNIETKESVEHDPIQSISHWYFYNLNTDSLNYHCGDCICVACSCSLCHCEDDIAYACGTIQKMPNADTYSKLLAH